MSRSIDEPPLPARKCAVLSFYKQHKLFHFSKRVKKDTVFDSILRRGRIV